MKTTLEKIHHQDIDWLRELDFYNEELTILSRRLEEVVAKNTIKQLLGYVEHFHNMFIMFKEQIDVLKHDINLREAEIESVVKQKPEHIGEKMYSISISLLERCNDLACGLAATRLEFNQFLSKVL